MSCNTNQTNPIFRANAVVKFVWSQGHTILVFTMRAYPPLSLPSFDGFPTLDTPTQKCTTSVHALILPARITSARFREIHLCEI